MDDELLVREFKRTSDKSDFSALVALHQGSVFRLVASILGPGHQGEAEEVTQDVFLKVYQKIHGSLLLEARIGRLRCSLLKYLAEF